MPLLLPAGQNCRAFAGSQQTHSYGCRRIRPYVSAIIAIHTFNEWHPFHVAFKLIAVCLIPLIKPHGIIFRTGFHYLIVSPMVDQSRFNVRLLIARKFLNFPISVYFTYMWLNGTHFEDPMWFQQSGENESSICAGTNSSPERERIFFRFNGASLIVGAFYREVTSKPTKQPT